MKVLISAKMGHGTFQAKLIPMSEVNEINEIFVVRKSEGPPIPKVKYIILPQFAKYSIFNLAFTPFFLVFQCLKLKPDFIVSYHFVPHGIFAFIAGLLTRTPNIFCQTGGICEVMSNKPVVGTIMKIMLKNAFHFNTPGYQSREFWIKFGVLPEKISVLHSTVNTDVFKPVEKVAFEFDYLYIGRLDPIKRIDWIIQALAENKKKNGLDFNLAIVGDGPSRNKLKELVKILDLEKNVHFLGFQTNVDPYIHKSKVFVMSSYSEGLPVALMEAMACEKLVIAPAVNNIPSVLIHEVTGFSFNKDDFEMLKTNLERAWLDYDKLEHCRKNARKIILDEYSYGVAKRKWNLIFQKK